MNEFLGFIGLTIFITALLASGLHPYLKRVKRRVLPQFSRIGPGSLGDDFAARIRKLDRRINGLTAILLICCFGMAYALLLCGQSARISLLPHAQPYWWIVATFLGSGMTFFALMPLARRLWPEDMAWYWIYVSRLRCGCDYDSYNRGIGVFLLLLGLIPIAPGINCYTQVRDDSMAVHPYFAIEETIHRFSAITDIVTARCYQGGGKMAGQIICESRYAVHFKDGTQWTPNPFDDISVGDSVEKALSAKSGIPITNIPVMPYGFDF